MKDTKIMVACIATYFLTWLFLAGVCYVVTALSYHDSLTDGTVLGFFIVLGWIPSMCVGYDLWRLYYTGETAHKGSDVSDIRTSELKVNTFRGYR